MRRLTVLLAACSLAFMGSSGAASADSAMRPFKGALSGMVNFVPSAGCPVSGMATVTQAAGQFSHMGAMTMTSRHCSALAFQGEAVLTAANGDQVFMSYDGSGPFDPNNPPEVIHLTGTYRIHGGTGRFDDATGSGTYTAALTFRGFGPGIAWPGEWVYMGTIGY